HLLAEDALLTAFAGDPASPQWLAEADAERLIGLKPDANVPPDIAVHQLASVTDHLPGMIPVLDEFARNRGQQLLEAHRRVRSAAGAKGSYRIDHSPPDVLGIYIFLPVTKL
ncbi:MAG: helicase, partial [Limisphaerales bacterium]